MSEGAKRYDRERVDMNNGQAVQRMLCANAEAASCDECNTRIVCEAELSGICVPVYARLRELGISIAEVPDA